MYLLQTWQILRRRTVTIDVPLSHCTESKFASKLCNKTFFPYLLRLWPFVWLFDGGNSTMQGFKSYTLHLRPLINFYKEHAYFNSLTRSFTLTHCNSCYWWLKLTSTMMFWVLYNTNIISVHHYHVAIPIVLHIFGTPGFSADKCRN